MTFLKLSIVLQGCTSTRSLLYSAMGALEVICQNRRMFRRGLLPQGGQSHRKPLTWVNDYVPYVGPIYRTIQERLCLGNWCSENSCSAIDLCENAGAINRMKPRFISYIKGFFLVVKIHIMANRRGRSVHNMFTSAAERG